ncbi:MAG TPA: response regulator transcription factor [Ignavibacteria bacterium]|nr:response regulator transcription factor [Ignavibacteria bacterium]
MPASNKTKYVICNNKKILSMNNTEDKMNLLIIEDSPLIVERIQNIVSKFNEISVIGSVDTVKEAEEKILGMKPDVIILDIHLQDGSGLGLQYLISSKGLDIKTVILTNYSSPILQEKSFEMGAKYFLDKSNDFEKLSDVLNEIIKDNLLC